MVATEAPLLAHQCERLAQRAALGLARVGSIAAHSSGDLLACFATGNDLALDVETEGPPELTVPVTMLSDSHITPLFEACVDATEEAVVNALLAAETMTGRDGITAHALPHDRVLALMARYGRGA